MACPCGGGVPDAQHVLCECAVTEPARRAALAFADGLPGTGPVWQAQSDDARFRYLISARTGLVAPELETPLRGGLPAFVGHVQSALDGFAVQNACLHQQMDAELAGAF